jgi:hypothetical protein
VPSAYAFVSDKAKGTITMYLSKILEDVTDSPPLVMGCSATFKLIAGYAFDQAPPSGAKCPRSARSIIIDGRTFCELCEAGSYKDSQGVCSKCPEGQFQNLGGATSCRVCPPGAYCSAESSRPEPCFFGSFNAKAGSGACEPCPANTFAAKAQATACTKCPPRATSPPGSEACGVFW